MLKGPCFVCRSESKPPTCFKPTILETAETSFMALEEVPHLNRFVAGHQHEHTQSPYYALVTGIIKEKAEDWGILKGADEEGDGREQRIMNSQGRRRSQHRRPGESSSIGSGAYFGSGGRGDPSSRRRVLYRRSTPRVLYRRTTPRPFIRRTSRPFPAVEWDRSDGPE